MILLILKILIVINLFIAFLCMIFGEITLYKVYQQLRVAHKEELADQLKNTSVASRIYSRLYLLFFSLIPINNILILLSMVEAIREDDLIIEIISNIDEED